MTSATATRIGFAILVTWLAVEPVVASRDATALEARCYRFDRAYFGWVGRPPNGGEVLIDSSRIIRLDTMPHASRGSQWAPSDAFAVSVPAMRVDTFTARRWHEMSFWRPITADSIEIHWRNGLYGPVLRLLVRGDSVHGRMQYTTDIVGAEPRPESATGARVECPQ